MVDPHPPAVLRVRRGRSPNCSATGSVVGLALLSAIATATVVNAFADRFARWVGRDRTPPDAPTTPPPTDPDAPRLRREGDGALLAWSDPPAVLWLDKAGTDAALAAGARPIGGAPAPAGALSAPIEVHVALTDRCPVACDGCYLDAGPDKPVHEPARDELRRDLDQLAAMGVLEVALGGGEVLLRDDALDVVDDVRARGMVPNLTISGFGLTDDKARRLAATVGQVNVSLDGLGDAYDAVRGWSGAPVGLKAIRRLRDAGARVGVNTVLTRANVHQLDLMADALAELGVVEWQWLRFKPAGRGSEAYERLALDPDDALALWPKLLSIEARTGLTLRFDCALVPFLVAHQPPPEHLDRLAVSGCPGGESLWSRTAEGRWAPCSFAREEAAPAGDVAAAWRDGDVLNAWRARAAAPPDPCGSCSYRTICRGGCRIVAGHVTGDPLAPDPECPRVRAFRAAA